MQLHHSDKPFEGDGAAGLNVGSRLLRNPVFDIHPAELDSTRLASATIARNRGRGQDSTAKQTNPRKVPRLFALASAC